MADYGDAILTAHYDELGNKTVTVTRADDVIGICPDLLAELTLEPDGTLLLAGDSRHRYRHLRDDANYGARVSVWTRVYHRQSIEGYWSPRCQNGMGGCDDLACVCDCHDATADHPATLEREP